MTDKPLVLIVDDDPDFVDMLTLKAEAAGYRTKAAYDGVEAWDRIKEERPALVLLDVMMPRKNGYDVCREIKSDPEYNAIPVILLTAVGSAVPTTSYTHRDGMTTEADEYVPKPVDPDRLLELVKEFLG